MALCAVTARLFRNWKGYSAVLAGTWSKYCGVASGTSCWKKTAPACCKSAWTKCSTAKCRTTKPTAALTREHFFGKYPELLELVKDMSDDEILHLARGGHDCH